MSSHSGISRVTIDAIVQLGALVMCLAVTTTAVVFAWSGLKPSPTPASPSGGEVKAGDTMKTGPSIPGGGHRLVLIVSPSCVYCTSSMPFYRDLAERLSGDRHPVQLLAAGSDPVPAVEAYLASHDVRVPVVPLGALGFRVRGTPTIVLVDDTNTVRRVWPGVLTEKGRAELEDALRDLSD